MHRHSIVACLTLVALSARAQLPDYEAMVALRSSFGFQAALDAANAQLSRDPNDATAAGVRALAYANAVDFLGMPDAQAREAKQNALAGALELSRSNPWTRAAYGLIHMSDEPERSERVLATCIEAEPGFLECYNLYGDMLRKTGRPEEAGKIYRRALDRWPGDGELRVSHALLLQESGQVEAALEALSDLTREQPRFAKGHWHLAGMLYESGGYRTLALQEAQAALRLDPLIWNGKKLLELLGDAETPTERDSAEKDGRVLPYSLELERRTQPWCPGDCVHAIPFVATYQRGDEKLVFVGVRHAFDPENPTMRAVAEGFSRIVPAVVVLEGFPSSMGENPAPLVQLAQRHGAAETDGFARGEAMYAASLALARGIPFLGGEPTQEERLDRLRAEGFTDADLAFDAVLDGFRSRYGPGKCPILPSRVSRASTRSWSMPCGSRRASRRHRSKDSGVVTRSCTA
jgi:tetratricopeptide (TPR) repeat protein